MGLISRLTDAWTSWDEPIPAVGREPSYEKALARARERTGADESVRTGRARIGGHDVAMIVSEFAFLGGSIGRDAATRIVSAARRATAEGLPLIALPASGGTRMQEGTPAFVTMADISRSVVAHKAAGLPYVVYLRHPTTGGVLASWGSLGHVTFAEPGALIGFLGPSVYEALKGEPFPEGVQTAENLAAKGLIDAVVPLDDLPAVLSGTLGTGPVRGTLFGVADEMVRLSGTGGGAIVCALATIGDLACVVVAQDGRVSPGHDDLRLARRGIRLAQELGRPLVCLIDTLGAELSVAQEERGLAAEVARCLADLVEATVPSVSVLLGAGCGGAALALFPARARIAIEGAWLSPLPLEGASVILHGHVGRADEMARLQRVTARDLLADGLIDEIVPATALTEAITRQLCAQEA